MSDNKKYYYLKLKDNFFDSEEIKVLESMENGYKYSNILLKMYLKSIKREGLLVFNERIPYSPKMIATVTNHNINDVKQALVLFQEIGMIETLSNGAIYMLDIQNFIGRSTTEADRIRAYRNKIEEKKEQLLDGSKVALTSDCTNVQQMNDKCTPELELELELELDIELEKDIENKEALQQTCKDNLKTTYKYSIDSDEVVTAKFMVDELIRIKPDSKTPKDTISGLQAWAKQIDYMIRLDRRAPKEICSLFRWAQEDTFWTANIRSPQKLREKWDTLEIQSEEGGNGGGNKGKSKSNTGKNKEYTEFSAEDAGIESY